MVLIVSAVLKELEADGSIAEVFFWVLYTKVLSKFLWVDFFVKSCQKLLKFRMEFVALAGFVGSLVYIGGGVLTMLDNPGREWF